MFTNDSQQDRGQVGIGTLIVFIALVLVAAIAAGVLINTAGFLQSQAEATGEESTAQVSNGLQVTGAVASINNNGQNEDPRITVSLASGSDPIDLSNIRIEAFGDATASSTSVDGLIDDSASNSVTTSEPTISSSSEYAVLDLSSGDLSLTISEGDEVELVITTSDGAETSEVLRMPDPVGTETSVSL
jgi:flagellin FlaB